MMPHPSLTTGNPYSLDGTPPFPNFSAALFLYYLQCSFVIYFLLQAQQPAGNVVAGETDMPPQPPQSPPHATQGASV